MLRAFTLGLIVAALSAVTACSVEPLTGCQTNDDCRYGRVCYRNVCRFLTEVPDVVDDTRAGDTSPPTDSSTDPGTSDPLLEPDQGLSEIRLTPNRVNFGRVQGGSVHSIEVSVINVGSDDIQLGEPALVSGNVFDAELTGPEVVARGMTSTIEVTARAPRIDPGAERSFEDELVLAFSGDSAGEVRAPIAMTVFNTAEEPCLTFDPTRSSVTLSVGESQFHRVDLINCGEIDIDVIQVDLTADDIFAELELDVDRLPLGLLEVGEDAPVWTRITGVASGTERAMLSVLYNGGRSASTSIVVDVAGGSCDNLGLFASADRDGPSSRNELTLPLGHQITLFPVGGARAGFLEIELDAAPADSSALLAFQNTRRALLVPDRVGTYTVAATIFGEEGCEVTATFVINVTDPEGELVAWVVWPEPFPDGPFADLDFYVARRTAAGGYGWQEEGFHVGPTSPTANFGDPDDTQDDPFLNQDYNTQGFGPEMIIIPLPSESEQIAIGVHAFQLASAQPVVPRIQISLGGPTIFDVELSLTANQFWLAAETLGTNLVESHSIVTDGFPGSDQP